MYRESENPGSLTKNFEKRLQSFDKKSSDGLTLKQEKGLATFLCNVVPLLKTSSTHAGKVALYLTGKLMQSELPQAVLDKVTLLGHGPISKPCAKILSNLLQLPLVGTASREPDKTKQKIELLKDFIETLEPTPGGSLMQAPVAEVLPNKTQVSEVWRFQPHANQSSVSVVAPPVMPSKILASSSPLYASLAESQYRLPPQQLDIMKKYPLLKGEQGWRIIGNPESDNPAVISEETLKRYLGNNR